MNMICKRVDHNDNECKDKENNIDLEIKSGDYWIQKQSGEVRLISSLNIIDNILHSVVVEPNPKTKWTSVNSCYSQQTYTVDDFLDKFEPIEQEKAKEIRKAELKELEAKLSKISKELAIGYKDKNDSQGATKKLTLISEKQKSDMSLPITMATQTHLTQIKKQTVEIKNIVEKQKDFIAKKINEIALLSKNLAEMYKEQASRSLAAVDGTIKFVARLEKSIHTLDIFAGVGVEIVELCRGKQANPNEKLHFYQRKLFLDEEFWVNIANGGADYSSIKDFKNALEKDISVIDRMIPSPKGIVLMQFRRNPKQYSENYNMSITDVLMKLAEDNKNQEQFLLIRNGKNVYMVFSDDIQGGERLFPTEQEIKEIFKKEGRFNGVEIDKYINFKDLENKQARDKMDNKSLYYKRLLLLLFGLHQRERLFGEGLKGDWLSKSFQSQKFAFVYDDENALDYKSKSLNDFIVEKNTFLQSGSRVIANWNRVMNEDNAPGMYSSSLYHNNTQIWKPIYSQEPHIVKSSNGRLYVSVKCKHWIDRKYRNIKCYITKNDDILVLDFVKSEEIEFYINSRKHRSSYATTAIFLLGARDILRKEEEEAKKSVIFLTEHIKKVYSTLDEGYISKKLFESISFWKVANNKDKLPDLTSGENDKVLKEIADIFFKKTVSTEKDKAVTFFEKNMDDLISITTNNKDKFYTYSIVSESDKIVLGADNIQYPFIKKTEWKKLKKTWKQGKSTQVLYGFYRKNEEVVKELYKLNIETKLLKQINANFFNNYKNLQNNIMIAKNFFRKILNKETIDELLEKMFKDMLHRRKISKSKYITEYGVSIPIEAYIIDSSIARGNCYPMQDKKIAITFQNTNLNMLIAKYGSDQLYNNLIRHIISYYARSGDEIEILKNIRENKDSSVFTLYLKEMPLFEKNNFFIKRKLDFNCCLVGANIITKYSQVFRKESTTKEILEKSFDYHEDSYKKKLIEKSFIEKIA